jgi:hypothetical protein
VSRNPALFNLSTQGAKGSFLVWEKMYQKLGEEEEQMWLLRSLESVARYCDGALLSAPDAR